MKTYTPKPQDIERRWYVLDAQDAVLGRLASQVATILKGKHKPIYAPHADTGDHVVVVNARGIRMTGGKAEKKFAYRHSGYPGGLKATSYARLLQQRPSSVIEKAVRGMLPKNRLGRAMAGKLHVYDGPEHRHRAQAPQPLQLGEYPAWTGLPGPRDVQGMSSLPAAKEPAAKRQAAKKPVAKKPAAKKPEAKGTVARKPAVKKADVKKRAAKDSTAKRTTAKRTTAKRTAAKRTTAKRTTAKRTTKQKG